MTPSSSERRYYDMAREGGSWDEFPRRDILGYIKARLKAGDAVLDVGCGTAEILNFISKDVAYVGMEKSEYALSEARKNWAARPDTVFADDIFLMKFPALKFNIILMLFSLEHLKEPRRVLLECLRVLIPGGILVIAAPNLEFPLAWPNALRHRSVWFRAGFIFLRLCDYLKRVVGRYSFRLIGENFTEATGRYEKKDDDLCHVVSSWEIVRFLEKKGCVLEKFWEERPLTGWRRFVRLLPAMRWYGVTLVAAFRKI